MAGRALEMVKLAESRPAAAVELCNADELWDGEMACFRVGGAAVLLVKLDGRFHAYQGRCPHQGVALVEGELDGGLLTCRAHRWQFDAASGRGVNPGSAHLKRFAVHMVGRMVSIEMAPDAADSTPKRLTQGTDDAA
jgi:nitrite reductase/ring-hydroxylating ferredoxin subunit